MTQIFAHRGARGYAPENTLESFMLAVRQKADGIELDVQMTSDGELVIIHDESVDRTSDHKGLVKSFTLNELKQFNFNNHNPEYPVCRIPTLEEVIQLIKPTDLRINIELKNGIFVYEGIEQKVLDLVRKYDMEDRVIYSSFNHYSIVKVKQMKPDAYCGFLHEDRFIGVPEYAAKYKMDAVHPALYFLIDEQYVKQARKYGLEINSWTINEPEHIWGALQLGIDILITDYPDRAIEIRRMFEEKRKISD